MERRPIGNLLSVSLKELEARRFAAEMEATTSSQLETGLPTSTPLPRRFLAARWTK
jgi:hypothetical protein